MPTYARKMLTFRFLMRPEPASSVALASSGWLATAGSAVTTAASVAVVAVAGATAVATPPSAGSSAVATPPSAAPSLARALRGRGVGRHHAWGRLAKRPSACRCARLTDGRAGACWRGGWLAVSISLRRGYRRFSRHSRAKLARWSSTSERRPLGALQLGPRKDAGPRASLPPSVVEASASAVSRGWNPQDPARVARRASRSSEKLSCRAVVRRRIMSADEGSAPARARFASSTPRRTACTSSRACTRRISRA